MVLHQKTSEVDSLLPFCSFMNGETVPAQPCAAWERTPSVVWLRGTLCSDQLTVRSSVQKYYEQVALVLKTMNHRTCYVLCPLVAK